MEKEKVMMAPAPVPRVVIKHSVIGSRAMNQYVSCVQHLTYMNICLSYLPTYVARVWIVPSLEC
jgi:hypothetical protein